MKGMPHTCEADSIRVQGMHVLSTKPHQNHLPLSTRSEQVCLASSDLLHTHLALAGTNFTYHYYYVKPGAALG